MSRHTVRPERIAIALVALFAAAVLGGCASAIDEGARHLGGAEDWRPAAPERETYQIHVGEGYDAPHPFRFEGPVEAAHVQGFDITATTGGLSATQVLHPFMEGTVFGDPAAMTEDGIARGDLRADQDVLYIGSARGRVEHDGTTTAILEDTLYVTAREGALVLTGALTLTIGTGLSLDDEGAHLAFAGWPFLHPMDDAAPPTSDLVARPDGEARIVDVRVRWGPRDDGGYANDLNGTLVLEADHAVSLGAPAFSFIPDTLAVKEARAAGSALAGHRTREPFGTLYLDAPASTFHLRDAALLFDRIQVQVRDLEGFRFDAATRFLEARGGADQVVEATRPWIESEIGFEHPSKEAPDLVTLRVPPGKTFRTMLGVREMSGVGTAMDVQPRTGQNDGDLVVTLGDRWEDARVLDDTLARAFMDTVASFFWVPDGEVRLGPHAVAYLPVSFDVPAGLEEPAHVELVLHPRNAAVVHVTFALEPDADAATSDVSSRSPAPAWMALAALGLLAVAARRAR